MPPFERATVVETPAAPPPVDWGHNLGSPRVDNPGEPAPLIDAAPIRPADQTGPQRETPAPESVQPGFQQEYVGMCLANQSRINKEMGLTPSKNLAQQDILHCIELSKMKPDGNFE